MGSNSDSKNNLFCFLPMNFIFNWQADCSGFFKTVDYTLVLGICKYGRPSVSGVTSFLDLKVNVFSPLSLKHSCTCVSRCSECKSFFLVMVVECIQLMHWNTFWCPIYWYCNFPWNESEDQNSYPNFRYQEPGWEMKWFAQESYCKC